jgi:hypothetical protein
LFYPSTESFIFATNRLSLEPLLNKLCPLTSLEDFAQLALETGQHKASGDLNLVFSPSVLDCVRASAALA